MNRCQCGAEFCYACGAVDYDACGCPSYGYHHNPGAEAAAAAQRPDLLLRAVNDLGETDPKLQLLRQFKCRHTGFDTLDFYDRCEICLQDSNNFINICTKCFLLFCGNCRDNFQMGLMEDEDEGEDGDADGSEDGDEDGDEDED